MGVSPRATSRNPRNDDVGEERQGPASMDPMATVGDNRRQRIEEVVAGRTRTLTVILEEVHDPHNLSAVLRTCECFGIQDVHVVEGPRSPFHTAKLVARGADKWLDVHRSTDVVETIDSLQSEGFTVLASRLEGASRPLTGLPTEGKLALLFGNESLGVSERALAACDGSFVVPMFGFTQSLNISVAAAVSLSWLTLHRAMSREGSPGDLTQEEAAALRERFALQAVLQKQRVLAGKKSPTDPTAGRQEDES